MCMLTNLTHMHAHFFSSDLQMMYIHIIFYRIVPPRVEMHKVFGPYFGISFDSFKVRVIVRFSLIRAARVTRGIGRGAMRRVVMFVVVCQLIVISAVPVIPQSNCCGCEASSIVTL